MRHPSIPPDEEQLLRIPEVPTLPSYHGPSAPKELEAECILYLSPDKKGWLTVTLEDGTSFKLETDRDIPLLFPGKYNFTYSKFNEMDCITKVLGPKQRASLYNLHYASFEAEGVTYNLFWIPGTARMRLQKGGNKRTSKYLINLANFTPRRLLLPMSSPFEDTRSLAKKFIEFHKYFPVNLISPASTTKDLVLSINGTEFSTFEELVSKGVLRHDDLRAFHTAYKGGRQETRMIGTIEGESGDMEKAYLRGLENCPGLYRNVLHIYRGTKFREDAHPGSWYKARVKVPLITDTNFPPIPFRLDLIYYPAGEFTSYVSKPYIEMMIEAGIEFSILKSCQIILLDLEKKPFKELCTMLRYFEDNYRSRLFPITVKSLHYPIVGHFLSIYEEVNEATGDITYRASQDYNPLFACAIQGSVAKYIWELSQVNDTVAIRVDKLTGRNLKLSEGFKPIQSGMHTFLTPVLKDDPGQTTYRDLIEASRDKARVRVHIRRRLSFREGYFGNTTGKQVDVTLGIPPTSGNRYVSEAIKRVGVLLDKEVGTKIPTIDRIIREGSTCLVRTPADLIDTYLNLFPPTQT